MIIKCPYCEKEQILDHSQITDDDDIIILSLKNNTITLSMPVCCESCKDVFEVEREYELCNPKTLSVFAG